MARRTEHSEAQIKEMVLQAAKTLVTEEGVGALKVREIAMEIGYTVGCIYKVFDNMADLILQLKAMTLDDLAAQLAQIPTTLPPEQHLLALMQTYLAFARQNFHRWQMLSTQRLTVEPLPVWYQDKQAAIFQSIELFFQQLAVNTTAAQQQQAARILWASVHGLCSLSMTEKDNPTRTAEIEHDVLRLTQSFIAGWLATV